MPNNTFLKIKASIEESVKLKQVILEQIFFDLSFVVSSNKTARVQEAHITAGHAVIEYVEDRLLQEGFLNMS